MPDAAPRRMIIVITRVTGRAQIRRPMAVWLCRLSQAPSG